MTDGFQIGAVPVAPGKTRFTVWAPEREQVTLVLPRSSRKVVLPALGQGYYGATVDECAVGTRYQFRLDDDGPFADPASRSQPDGVHGPSEVIDLAAYVWGDDGYRPRPLWEHVISEVHVGTLTPEGTLDAAIEMLDDLVAVGISAVELMPLAQFPGARNWGYDGVFPFAVQSSYGGAAALQRFVDACHRHRLGVILDVVYNHLGPEGNVLGAFAPYFTDRYRTPWGPAVNFDGAWSDGVRAYFLQNAQQWLGAFHIDGLRLDAVHEIIDRSARPFLVDLAERAALVGDRAGRIHFLVAESADNNPRTVTSFDSGGIGMDAQWNDDFHHAVHAAITGERIGYYADYGTVDDIARALNDGFVYQGEFSSFRRHAHGAPSVAIPPERLVGCVQNHDQIGNRPKGDRLVTLVPLAQAQLATALLLLSPGVPLLFMGEEYGDPAPFPYFIDHGDPALVEAVRTGRAREFPEFARTGQMLDPADEATFGAARVNPALRDQGDHRCRWALHQTLIALRRSSPALQRSPRHAARASAAAGVVSLLRSHPLETVVAFFNVSGDEVDAPLPAPSPGSADTAATSCWLKLLDAGAPQFGGRGEALPARAEVGQRLTLRPWEFCAYQLASPVVVR